MFILEDFGSLDSLPCGSYLDEDAWFWDILLSVEVDDAQGFGDGGFGVKGETGVDFGGDVSRDNLGNFLPKVDSKLILLYLYEVDQSFIKSFQYDVKSEWKYIRVTK